ncbi:MAG: zf-HC2 domain-containing protein [Hahellaceae bacterium]|nr:zf-HC2 domain-containing protein [Hahellaceae bacterium]
MNCRQATRMLSDALEDTLPFKSRAALKLHIVMCASCRNFGQQMGVLRQLTHDYAKTTDGEAQSLVEKSKE